jgi:cell wall-associated NlpC family hydrolase
VSPGHPGPPAGDLSHQLGWFMWALRMHESSGKYKAGSRGAACGAYQYMPGTWNNYQGYRTACDAPPSVQDKRATSDVLKRWKSYHMWQQVATAHFYPAWASSTANWGRCPAACNVNPTVWEYVDDVMNKMRSISQKYPVAIVAPAIYPAGPGVADRPGPATNVALRHGTPVADRTGLATGVPGRRPGLAAGVLADGCPVPNPSPPIGGKGAQGSGPYLLSPAAAADMRNMTLDPQNPCESSYYVARKLGEAANKVHADPSNPRWVPNGSAKDIENARKYWSKAVEVSGIFVDRTADPNVPCAVPPPDDPKKPWSVSFKIISVWHCETGRMSELYVVTGGKYDKGTFTYTVETDRSAATQMLVNEALSVSYAASGWKTDTCDDKSNDRQGIFPMTQQEAAAAGVTDRCDEEKNIVGAARLVLSGEKIQPEKRDHTLGVFQPMAGGWQKLGIAMGQDLPLFSKNGPGRSFTPTDACTKVMTGYLTSIAPFATAFATLQDPPGQKNLDTWQQQLTSLDQAHALLDPASDPACAIGSGAPGFNAQFAQIATGLAGANPMLAPTLNGLGNHYQAAEDSLKATDAVLGQDTLVMPRLAVRPLHPIKIPDVPDATSAWSRVGSTDGVTLPLSQVSIDYAWFFGGVIAPFDSAGKRIGSLAGGDTTSPGGGTGPIPNLPPNTPELIQKVLTYAYAQLDTPYVYGGTCTAPKKHYAARTNCDCSSLTQQSYARAGISIPRTADTQYWHGPRVPPGQEQIGDLVFFHYTRGMTGPGHVGIVVDPATKRFIEAPHTGDVVKFWHYGPSYLPVGFTRPAAGTGF